MCISQGCAFPGENEYIQDKSYIHRIRNIVLTANWHEYDWGHIRRFIWADWKDITIMVCRELLLFSGLRRLTLDWRVPNPCDVLQPTAHQWLSIFPHFEILQTGRPDICIEMLAWQIIPWSVPVQYREIRRGFGEYTRELLRANERPTRYILVFVPSLGYWIYQWPQSVAYNQRYQTHQWPVSTMPLQIRDRR